MSMKQTKTHTSLRRKSAPTRHSYRLRTLGIATIEWMQSRGILDYGGPCTP